MNIALSDCPVLAGVIGFPNTQSLSPLIHQTWLDHFNINGHYVSLSVKKSSLKRVLTALPLMGFRGVNITMPYKQTILNYADHYTPIVDKIEASNHLTFSHKKITADNTDAKGFSLALLGQFPTINITQQRVLILGAGGAARAIAAGLLEQGVRELVIINRNLSNNLALQATLKQYFPTASIHIEPLETINDCLTQSDILIQTTPQGMRDVPYSNNELGFDLSFLPSHAIICDIVYRPLHTLLLQHAILLNYQVMDGLEMLLYQAAISFKQWFDCPGTLSELVMLAKKKCEQKAIYETTS